MNSETVAEGLIAENAQLRARVAALKAENETLRAVSERCPILRVRGALGLWTLLIPPDDQLWAWVEQLRAATQPGAGQAK